MAREYILVTDFRVTKLLIEIIKQVNLFDKQLNLSDYSTRFGNVR